MQKDAYYFSHDSNAWSDSKILKLRVIYKDKSLWAYGLFWVIVEKMRDEPGHKLYLENMDELALYIGGNTDEIRTYVNNCIKIKLFESDEEHFWSQSLLRRMQQYYDKCNKAKDAINKRWEDERNKKNDTDVLPPNNEGITDVIQGKETKLKEIKEKENTTTRKESPERETPTSGDSPSGYKMKASGKAITIKQYMIMSAMPNFKEQIEKVVI
jgi:hypothetical protein